MADTLSPLAALQQHYADSTATPRSVVEAALKRTNSNTGANVYLAMDKEQTLAEADALPMRFPSGSRPRLFGVPVSIKDCFDLSGFPTTGGSHFYAERSGLAHEDSAVARRLRQAGAIITGKTHLHQLAYGITGENPDYGDCVQPRNANWLTGGSSSGAAASVQEGSAIAAIGTDTGGSIRVPAALCGLAGYRSSYGLANSLGLWRGAMHLAPSFDTLGWLFRDLRDGPHLAEALFGAPQAAVTTPDLIAHPVIAHPVIVHPRIGAVGTDFLHDCEGGVLDVFETCKTHLRKHGAEIEVFDSGYWSESMEIFASIQAHEAAAIHHGNFAHFEAGIAERLAWGESIPAAEVTRLRKRHVEFRERMDALLHRFDFIVLPCAPMCVLQAGADHSATRRTILRYTSPISLAGMPTVTLCSETLGSTSGMGSGVQLVAARGDDARLLAFAASLVG